MRCRFPLRLGFFRRRIFNYFFFASAFEMLTMMSPSDPDEESSELVPESEPVPSEELALESIVARLILPFLDLILLLRRHLRELCPILLQFEQRC